MSLTKCNDYRAEEFIETIFFICVMIYSVTECIVNIYFQTCFVKHHKMCNSLKQLKEYLYLSFP